MHAQAGAHFHEGSLLSSVLEIEKKRLNQARVVQISYDKLEKNEQFHPALANHKGTKMVVCLWWISVIGDCKERADCFAKFQIASFVGRPLLAGLS